MTQRSYYYLAGQLIAARVKKPASDVYYYAYTDHLGNVVAWSWTSGTPSVTDYLSRYEPFGGYRTRPDVAINPDISSRGFTGHRGNNTGAQGVQNLNLIYMNARYYMPEIGRFISADTIVPDPANPQSYNRYSYTLNSPVNFTDPTGHLTEQEIHDFFGFTSPEEMIEAGWAIELVELLWDISFTWGNVFAYDNGAGYAMLALFEAGDPSATTLEGGFYGVWGAQEGQRVDPTSISNPDDHDPDADFIESLYRNNWGAMPVSYDGDYTGIPSCLQTGYLYSGYH